MSGAPKKSRIRARKAIKNPLSRQTSLLDVFSLKTSSKKSTTSTFALPSDNEYTAGEEVIDVLSSDADPLAEGPVDSSSPFTAPDEDGPGSGTIEQKGTSFENHTGGSRETPIFVLDSSPVASPSLECCSLPAPPSTPKALYSIFAPRQRAGKEASPQRAHVKSSTKSVCPFPDGTSQHVRGLQTTLRVPLVHFSLREAPSNPVDLAHQEPVIYSRLNRDSATKALPSFLPSNTHRPTDTAERPRRLDSIPLNHRSYPAVSRMLDTLSLTDVNNSQQLWVDRWRPLRADEVLGNEQSALYLRDWLLALRLQINGTDESLVANPPTSDRRGKQKGGKLKKTKEPRGTKRPRVVRDVERKRRRLDSEEPEDMWLADDIEDGDPLDMIGVEDEFPSHKPSRLRRANSHETSEANISQQPLTSPLTDATPPFSYTPPSFGDTICNTIILTGPTGCGKTAAVYACAEELGWDVFEVYPGIGERSGAALQKLVGEVGKNHLVRQTQHKSRNKRMKAKPDFLGKRVMSDDEADESQGGVMAQGGAGITESTAATPPGVPTVSQSIVLVEEVDILYREDANFWPTMIKIIKECRRPVVMTCNDISLVPQQDLPLQTALHFMPCPVGLAVSYLQLLSLAEGRFLEPNVAKCMYESSGGDPVVPDSRADSLLHPRLLSRPNSDLRRTINRFQFNTGVELLERTDHDPQLTTRNADDSLEELKLIAKSLELCSFADSGLRRSKPESMRDLLSDNASPCADDIVGFKHLVAESGDSKSCSPVIISAYDRDETIINELFALSRQHYPSQEDIVDDMPDLPPLHTSHCASLLPLLHQLYVPHEHAIRSPESLFLDYEPWIRHMVVGEDARIAAYMATTQTEGMRRTRNSQRSKWEAQCVIPLDDEQRDTLRRIALETNRHGYGCG